MTTVAGESYEDQPHRGRTSGDYARMWFGFFGGPLAWSVSELVPYMLVSHACFPNLTLLPTPAPTSAWVAAVVVTCVMLVVSLAALVVATQDTMRFFVDAHGYAATAAESNTSTARRYLAFGGVLLAAVFGSMIVYNLIALVAQSPCHVP